MTHYFPHIAPSRPWLRSTRYLLVILGCLAAEALGSGGAPPASGPVDRPQKEERLSFQAYDAYRPRVHLNADVAMVYGIDESLPDRIQTWRDRGYIIHVMTGVAWGDYQDYYFGRWDGKNREDEAQRMKNGEVIGHGGDVYYMAPGEDYGRYLCQGVRRALDAGAEAIHLEEPEFWVRAGWSGSFKRQWQKFYGEPWVEPDSSPDAQYRASKLKYHLYKKTLAEVFDFVKTYAQQHGRDIKCYVPTHSMINYAHWGIVSPESSLLEVGADGFIAQVWTGTARTPNYYDGRKAQRTFETAFLEYGAMQNIVRASGKRVWYLNDPIEDNPGHSWWDYRTNWESTLVASLLQPEVWHYEIMPWPHRIYEGRYPATQPGTGTAGADVPRIPIPDAYETELQAVISAMGDMCQPADHVSWEHVGTLHTGVLVSDTLMFQRFGPDASDSDLGHFYGLALPLLMRGLPVEPVQIETAELSRYKTLLLSYEGQKPPKPEFHDHLAAWVKAGGALVVIDDDRDPFHKVREWWNTAPMHYATPRHHLFDALGLAHDATGQHTIGRGTVIFDATSPSRLSRTPGGAEHVRDAVKKAMAATGQEWKESPALVLRRGSYIIAAGLEFAAEASPVTLKGRFIPLFDPDQPVIREYHVGPGTRGLLVDLDRYPKDYVGVVAAACRVTNQVVTDETVTFDTIGQAETAAVISVLMPQPPRHSTINGAPLVPGSSDYADGVFRMRFPNLAQTIRVVITR
ncbi:MAG TPA: hypothetical protein PK458_19045 [Phycisphaerae bacterium]|nr:hypothetical protein [Phycisphaerae bacterium]